MKKLLNILLTLALAVCLLAAALAVPSASVNEEAEDRYMEHMEMSAAEE